jgi:hypothetical protein
LKFISPYDKLIQIYQQQPELFKINPSHKIMGLNNYVRSDLGPTPNFLDGGRGVGGEVDLSLNYAVTDAWDIGVSGNYKVMYGTGDASAVDVSGNNIEGGSSRLQNIRYGAGVNVGYHF